MFAVSKAQPRKKIKNIEHNSAEKEKKSAHVKVGSSPTLVTLRNIPIHFPFKPYQCQEDYMMKVVTALLNSENALLESPTGTGKTLCLLCSSLAWQKDHNSRQQLKSENNNITNLPPKQVNVNGNANHQQSDNNKSKNKSVIIYASRTHSQLSQVVRELKSTRYRPKHAVLGSREQFCVNEKVTRKYANNNTMLNHACNQLAKKRSCMWRNNLDHFNNQAHAATEQEQPVLDIEELNVMGRKHKVCPFYYSRNALEHAELVLLPYNYLFDRAARDSLNICWKDAVVIFDEAHNLESFASDASSFELTSVDIGGCVLEVQKAVGVLQQGSSGFHAVDGDHHGSVNVDNLLKLKSMFLMLEEALDQAVPSGGSFSGDYIFQFFRMARLTYSNHDIFLKFVRQVSDLIMESRGGAAASATPRLDNFASCLRKAFGGNTEAHCIAKTRAYRVYISPSNGTSNKQNNSSSNNKQQRMTGQASNRKERTLSYWCFAPALAMIELEGLGLRSIIVTSGTLSPMKSYSLELGLKFDVQLENPHIVKQNQIHVRIMGRGVSNKELKSTYDRRNDKEYITEMGNTLCALAKIIPGGMLIFFPSYGAMNTCIEGWGGPSQNSTWLGDQGRKKQSFFVKRGGSSSSNRKNNNANNRYSFPYAPNYYNESNQSPWKRLLSHKAIVLEPKSTAEMKGAIEDFDKYIDDPKGRGCILMGVTRGKISEGIDFADGRARAVIITGIPFPPLHDQKIKLKREYLDGVKVSSTMRPTGEGGFDESSLASQRSETISGTEWYSQQAHRAVNQAVGRVIRHRFDYGAIILMDSRFGDVRNREGISKWVRPAIQSDQGMGRAISGLARFYKEARSDPELSARAPISKDTARRRIDAINLEYEKEQKEKERTARAMEEEMTPTMIAVIKTSESSKEAVKSSQDDPNCSSYVKPERVIRRFVVKGGREQKQATEEENSIASAVEETSLGKKRNETKASVTKGLAAIYGTKKAKVTYRTYGANQSTSSDTIESAWETVRSSRAERTKSIPSMIVHRSGDLNVRQNKVSKSNYNSRTNLYQTNALTKASKERSKNNASEGAQMFFQAIKQHLTSDDFIAARTIVVEMKSFGDKQDSTSYLRVAKELVQILLKYDPPFPGGFPPLLYPLLPTRHRGSVQSIVASIQARQAKAKYEKQPKKVGEDTLNTVLFRKSEHAFVPKDEDETQTKSEESAILTHLSENEKRQSLLIARDLKERALERVNSLMSTKRSMDKNKQNNQTCSRNQHQYESAASRKTPRVLAPIIKNEPVASNRAKIIFATNIAKQEKEAANDPVMKSLMAAESSSYVEKQRRISASKIKANVPSGVVCTICQTKPKRPLLAKCGHSACSDCWDNWLDRLRKDSCPVCRKSTVRKDLAYMVYEKGSGEGVPTLTQMCRSDNELSDDGDGEGLEFIE